MRILGWLWLVLLWTGWLAWSLAALWFDGPGGHSVPLVAGLLAVCLLLVVMLRPLLGFLVSGLLLGLVLAWWLSLAPRNDRDWAPEVAALPSARIDGDRVTIENVRNFDYRTETDFTPRWETRSYDLSRLSGLDIFISYWGPRVIAHTIMSWEFEDGQHLAISIETRRERGETYNALAGFFRQFELYYVVADERDVVGLRTNHRGEQVFLYRLWTPRDRARAILVDYLESIDELVEAPAWYNALIHNCTTTIALHAENALRKVTHPSFWNWRLLANGHLDELFYEHGAIDTQLPFAEMRAASDVTARARAGDLGRGFSERIRVGLPPRPPFKGVP